MTKQGIVSKWVEDERIGLINSGDKYPSEKYIFFSEDSLCDPEQVTLLRRGVTVQYREPVQSRGKLSKLFSRKAFHVVVIESSAQQPETVMTGE